LQEKYGEGMERCYGAGYDWRNALLMGTLCMLVVAERLMDGEIITIFVLYFDVLLKCSLYILNFEGTQCSMA
jgi:hypothetical protein